MSSARKRLGFVIIFLSLAPSVLMADSFEKARERMIREIENDARETSRWVGKASFDEKVIQAMTKTPRHLFVPPELMGEAYVNRPLPIGYGQTISQPYIVALMTDLLELKEGDVALEIGTGSGYQAAILSELVSEVYTIEIIKELGDKARKRLKRLGHENVTVRVGDGYYGWEDEAPFDAIVVTAAATHIPPPLIKQLKPGGRMVIPVGGRFMTQSLTFVEKDLKGAVKTRQVLPVIFVPLTGEH